MPDLISSMSGMSLTQCYNDLQSVLSFINRRITESLTSLTNPGTNHHLACALKRELIVNTHGCSSGLVGKKTEKLGEAINQMATVEHLVVALKWAIGQFPNARVQSCDPTTSSAGLFDLVIEDQSGAIFAVFEVTDTDDINKNKGPEKIRKLQQYKTQNRQSCVFLVTHQNVTNHNPRRLTSLKLTPVLHQDETVILEF